MVLKEKYVEKAPRERIESKINWLFKGKKYLL